MALESLNWFYVCNDAGEEQEGDRVNFVVGDEGDSATEDSSDMVMVGDERRDSCTSQSSDTLQDFASPLNGRTMDGGLGIMERRRRLR